MLMGIQAEFRHLPHYTFYDIYFACHVHTAYHIDNRSINRLQHLLHLRKVSHRNLLR